MLLVVAVVEVTLGGKGGSTTSDRPGPLASPPVAVVVVEELLVLEVEAVEVVVEELGPGWCLPLIQVWEVWAACLALALASSLSFSAFLALSFSNFFSFSLVAFCNSALAFFMACVCRANFSRTSSWTALIPLPLPVAGTGATAVWVAGTAVGLGGAAARTLPAWAEALARSRATR